MRQTTFDGCERFSGSENEQKGKGFVVKTLRRRTSTYKERVQSRPFPKVTNYFRNWSTVYKEKVQTISKSCRIFIFPSESVSVPSILRADHFAPFRTGEYYMSSRVRNWPPRWRCPSYRDPVAKRVTLPASHAPRQSVKRNLSQIVERAGLRAELRLFHPEIHGLATHSAESVSKKP